jgi:hypothetical protein
MINENFRYLAPIDKFLSTIAIRRKIHVLKSVHTIDYNVTILYSSKNYNKITSIQLSMNKFVFIIRILYCYIHIFDKQTDKILESIYN